MVNWAVNHVGADMDAEQADDQDPEPVAEDSERDHEGHQRELAPPGFEEDAGREEAGDEEHPTGADPAALLGHLEGDAGQLNTWPWRKTVVPAMRKYRAAASAEASMEAFSSQSTAASGRGTMKIRKAIGKALAAIHCEPRNR